MTTRSERMRAELKIPPALTVSFAFALAAFLASCSGNLSFAHRQDLGDLLQAERYEEAVAAIEESSEVYGGKNAVLYDMNLGAAAHYAAQVAQPEQAMAWRARSNAHLGRAERQIAELYTRRIGRAFGAFLSADTLHPFEGAAFEKIQIHVIRALGYAVGGELDEALVEVRRMVRRLQMLRRSQGPERGYRTDAFGHLLSGMLFEDDGDVDSAVISYRKAARAYAEQRDFLGVPPPSWLGAVTRLLCRDQGLDLGECAPEVQGWFPEIGRRDLDEREPVIGPPRLPAEPAAPADPAGPDASAAPPPGLVGPPPPPPRFESPEIPALPPPGPRVPGAVRPARRFGRVNVVQYLGLAPQIDERTVSMTVGHGVAIFRSLSIDDDDRASGQKALAAVDSFIGETVVMAFPELRSMAFDVRGAEIWFVPVSGASGARTVRTEVVQDLGAIAARDLQDRMPGIRGRTIVRAIAKLIATKVAAEVAEAASKKAWVGLLVGLAGRVASNMSEEADTRSWFSLPAAFAVARIELPPGRYRGEARVLGRYDRVLSVRDLGEVRVRPGVTTWVPLITLY